ncbi:glycosyltransferase family protein [Agromyces sp. SYSU T0242]|uniref:glycosyltransferase family protein n=1 Tax=Agromyces litoreus TaxID=3158561 RepID=UPI0033925CA5
MTPPHPEPDIRAEYERLVSGGAAEGERGRILFYVSTTDLDEGKGDVYVAAGLAKHLARLGWGVDFRGVDRWTEAVPDGVDAIVAMLESFIPGHVPQEVRRVAWIRNWSRTWADLPFLEEYDEIWCSSEASRAHLADRFRGPVAVLPIGVDADLFRAERATSRPHEVITTANFWGVARELQSAIAPLAARRSLTWYGANAGLAELPEGVHARSRVAFFELPRVYAEAELVVDDLIPAAKEFGTHNSRLFEAIACGAIPIVNTREGLDELGLGAVPAYDSPESLLAIADGLLDDPEGREQLRESLRAVVTERHGYAARAEVASERLEALRRRAPADDAYERLLAWTTDLREDHRAADLALDHFRADAHEVGAERNRLAGELEGTQRALDAANSRLRQIEQSLPYRAWRRVRRLLPTGRR